MLKFEDIEKELEKYCKVNGLSFRAAKSMSKAYSNDFVLLQYHNPDSQSAKLGLLDETPMPAVLKIVRAENGFLFEKTENTEKYLSEDMLGEYDPPYDFETEPSEEDIERAKRIIEKYEKRKK